MGSPRPLASSQPLTGTSIDAHQDARLPKSSEKFDPDFFGHQLTSARQLPDPESLLVNLTRCIIEVLAGARELEQLSRWISEDVYAVILKRAVIAARARKVKGVQSARPTVAIGRVVMSSPADGIVESVVIVHGRSRTRAVAIRLEGIDRRWRATSIGVL